MKKIKQNWEYLLITVFAIIVFVSIYGIHVINPLYTDWLLSGGDLSQHYLGWRAYRNSSWLFPIGMVDVLAYPTKTSLIFTDSIPIMACFFKILATLLPNDFQYFGIWGILCFILQGILSARILKYGTNNKVLVIVPSMLFIYAPVAIMRMFGHTALAGQWVLLYGLEPLFANDKYKHSNKIYIVAGLMGILSATVHIYFVLMSGIILVAICIKDIIENKQVKRSIMLLCIYLLVVGICIAILGGFSIGASSAAAGLGSYSMNLNAFFNPWGWSNVFISRPFIWEEQSEGFAYLGAGVIFVFIIAVLILLSQEDIKRILVKKVAFLIAISTMCAISLIIALSPIVTLGEEIILEYFLPGFIMKIWSTFRATGRLSWILVYAIMLCSCIVVLKKMNKRAAICLLGGAVILQIYDIHSVLEQKNNKFNQIVHYDSLSESNEFWRKMGENENIKHLVITIPDIYVNKLDELYLLADWALDYGKTINQFHFARLSSEDVKRNINESLLNSSTDTIFLFFEENKLNCLEYNLNVYDAGNYIIGYSGVFDGYTPINKRDISMEWTFGNEQYLEDDGGEDKVDGRYLYAGKLSYGPYWQVSSGTWVINISGEDLDTAAEISIYSQYGQQHHDFYVKEETPNNIVIQLSLEQNVEDLEILVRNISKETIKLRSIELKMANE